MFSIDELCDLTSDELHLYSGEWMSQGFQEKQNQYILVL